MIRGLSKTEGNECNQQKKNDEHATYTAGKLRWNLKMDPYILEIIIFRFHVISCSGAYLNFTGGCDAKSPPELTILEANTCY